MPRAALFSLAAIVAAVLLFGSPGAASALPRPARRPCLAPATS